MCHQNKQVFLKNVAASVICIHSTSSHPPDVRLLTWAFHNVLHVRDGKLITRLWRSQRSRTVVWGGLRWDKSWKKPATAATGAGATPTAAVDTPRRYANRTPTEPVTSAGVILAETGQFLLLCSLQLCPQLQRCRETRARVPLFSDTLYFRSVETVRRERHVS